MKPFFVILLGTYSFHFHRSGKQMVEVYLMNHMHYHARFKAKSEIITLIIIDYSYVNKVYLYLSLFQMIKEEFRVNRIKAYFFVNYVVRHWMSYGYYE